MNAIIVLVQFVLGCVLIGVFSRRRVDTNFDDWVDQSNAIRDLFIAVLCFVIGVLTLIICFLGCFAICCRCCICLTLLVPVTLVVAVALMIVSTFKDRLDDLIDRACDDITEGDLANFWAEVIEVPMCSDMCPCNSADFTGSGYDTMTDNQLRPYRRSQLYTGGEGDFALDAPNTYDTDESGSQMPLFTQDALIEYLGTGDGTAGLASLTVAILGTGGGTGPMDTSGGNEPAAYIYSASDAGVCLNGDDCTKTYIPPTVSTYRECFDSMLDNQEFSTDQATTDEEQDDWSSFTDEDAWTFLGELEDEYNCAGICETSLWYLTKNINQGQPTQECLRPLFDDVFSTTQSLCMGVGAVLALSFLCQLGLCGGMPADPNMDEPENDVTQVTYDQQPSGYDQGVMRPGYAMK